jgi:cyclopropane-fatty-acyl-phospholipid synthase
MPSHHLIRQYADLLEVEKEWRWSGTHYQRIALDRLGNFDSNREIESILRNVYGNDTALWMRRWRWFFLATAGLFGYADGSEWGVSHCRMKSAGDQLAASTDSTHILPNLSAGCCSPRIEKRAS